MTATLADSLISSLNPFDRPYAWELLRNVWQFLIKFVPVELQEILSGHLLFSQVSIV
jgi:hypothetical protein